MGIKKTIKNEKEARERRRREKQIDMFFFAIKSGDLKTVKKMYTDVGNVNIKDQKGETPLFVASKFGKTEIVKFMIGKGADINSTSTRNNLTPLHNFLLNNTHYQYF